MVSASTQKNANAIQFSKRYCERSIGSSWTSNSPAALRTCSCSSAIASSGLPALLLFPALAESLGGVVHVPAHGGARGAGVVTRDRRHDVAVVADRHRPELRRVEVMLEAQEKRPLALDPERPHNHSERAVTARFVD